MRSTILSLSLLLLTNAPASAQVKELRINVEVEDADLWDVMESIGNQVDRNILVDPSVDERVTVSLKDIPWREAVEVIAKMTRCVVEEREGGILLLSQPVLVTLAMEGGSADTAIRTIVSMTGSDVIVLPGMEAHKVDLDLKETPWLKALATLTEQIGAEVIDLGDLLIVGPKPLPAWFGQRAAAQQEELERQVDSYGDGEPRDLDAEDVDLVDLCEQIGRQVGVNIVVSPQVQERVTVSLHDISWREALDVIARMTYCEVERWPGDVLVLSQPARISLDFSDVDVRTVLQLIAAYSGKNVVLSPTVSGRIPELKLRDVRAELALQVVAHVAGHSAVNAGDAWLVGVDLITTVPVSPGVSNRGDPATLDVLDVDLADACEQLSAQAGVPIAVAAGVDERLTLELREVPWRDVLAIMAEFTGCEIETRPDDSILLSQPPQALIQATRAPAATLLRLLGQYGGLDLEVDGDVTGWVTLDLKQLPWARAVELVACSAGLQLERGQGGAIRIRAGEAEATPPARARVEPMPAADDTPPPPPADLGARVTALFVEIHALAQARDHEELVTRFTVLRELMSSWGAPAVKLIRAGLQDERFNDYDEVRLSIRLQIYISEGNALLKRLTRAIQDERWNHLDGPEQELEALNERMLAEEREVFHRNADALLLRGHSLIQRGRELEQVAGILLEVVAIVITPGERSAAVINGRVYREGDEVLDASREPIEGLRVAKINGSAVRFDRAGFSFIRELLPN